MIRKLLCWFGLHDPVISETRFNGWYTITCAYCGRAAG
jgi:hypothetical protein